MKYIKAIIAIFLLVCLDQYTKYVVIQRLEMFSYQPILGDVFGLYYLENRGMAWGLFQNKQILFLIFTVIILIALSVCFVVLSKDSKFIPITVCIEFLMAGAIGNMIDRIFRGDALFQGAVVDFLYIKIIDFPVFNVADIFVTCSVGVLVLLLLFRYKEGEFKDVFQFKETSSKKYVAQENKNNEIDIMTDVKSVIQNEHSKTVAKCENSIAIDEIFNDEEEEDE